jgi:hypothetical protein
VLDGKDVSTDIMLLPCEFDSGIEPNPFCLLHRLGRHQATVLHRTGSIGFEDRLEVIKKLDMFAS